jgi:hypothetical protein
MIHDKDWREVVEQAEHYLAIGEPQVYLHGCTDYPWEYVTRLEPGGSHRLDMDTSVWFTAEHPSGLSLRWTFDMEPRSANGSGSYHIDTDGVRAVLRALPTEARGLFRAYLRTCADKVQAKATEWRQIAERQATDAQTLYDLAAS